LPVDRLLAIIETQNEIAATALDLEAVMSLVVERAQTLTAAEAAVIELADGVEMVYHVARGTAAGHRGCDCESIRACRACACERARSFIVAMRALTIVSTSTRAGASARCAWCAFR